MPDQILHQDSLHIKSQILPAHLYRPEKSEFYIQNLKALGMEAQFFR